MPGAVSVRRQSNDSRRRSTMASTMIESPPKMLRQNTTVQRSTPGIMRTNRPIVLQPTAAASTSVMPSQVSRRLLALMSRLSTMRFPPDADAQALRAVMVRRQWHFVSNVAGPRRGLRSASIILEVAKQWMTGTCLAWL